MRIFLACLFATMLVVGGLGLYWQHKLAPVMNDPAARLIPVPLPIHTPSSVRHIDVGYAAFDLPAEIRGAIVQQGNSQFMTIAESKTDKRGMTICPLVSNSTPEKQSLLDQYQRLAGRRPQTFWELEKTMLFTKPFSVWSIPFRGRRQSVTDAVLLGMKESTLSRANSVLYYETESLGVVVAIGTADAFISITDKQQGTGQNFIVRPAYAREVASTLAQSYRLRTSDFTEAHLLKLIAQAGIRRREIPDPPKDTNVSIESETDRLQAVVDQVRAQRAAAGH